MKKIVLSFLVLWLGVTASMLLADDFSWEDIGRENFDCQVILVNVLDSKIIFAGKPGSILKTDNAGKSWRRVLAVKGTRSKINALAGDKSNHNVVYAATNNGLYRSSNLGERWERIFRGKMESENQCTAVLATEQKIFLGTQAGLFISRDDGRSWQKQQVGMGCGDIINIESGAGRDGLFYLAAFKGVFKSLDDGKSWEKIIVDNVRESSEEEVVAEKEDYLTVKNRINYVMADKNNPHLLYYSSVRGVYKSADQGQSWVKLTEYGLLNRDVKMICLAKESGLYALGTSGVFLYTPGRWVEISIGLAAGKLNYFVLDNKSTIYVAAEKGVYKSKLKNALNSSQSVMLQEYLKTEPEIKDVQEAAIKYAEVSPEKIAGWRKQVSRKAWLPKLSADLGRNTTDLWHWETGSSAIGQSGDDLLRRGKDSLDWDVSISWDLSELIWSADQTSIDVRSKLMVELRDDILDQVNKLYFERLRVKSELDNLAIEDRSKRFDKQLKFAELTASLDALTSGYYSEQLRLLAQKQQG